MRLCIFDSRGMEGHIVYTEKALWIEVASVKLKPRSLYRRLQTSALHRLLRALMTGLLEHCSFSRHLGSLCNSNDTAAGTAEALRTACGNVDGRTDRSALPTGRYQAKVQVATAPRGNLHPRQKSSTQVFERAFGCYHFSQSTKTKVLTGTFATTRLNPCAIWAEMKTLG